jgi:integrase/recombinase XerD
MLLPAKDVDIATIALWLGHENTKTTHIYEHADPALKEQAIARIAPFGTKPGRYQPPTRSSRSSKGSDYVVPPTDLNPP